MSGPTTNLRAAVKWLKMAHARLPRRVLVGTQLSDVTLTDFSDAGSQRVLDATARSVARELGKQCARELWKRR